MLIDLKNDSITSSFLRIRDDTKSKIFWLNFGYTDLKNLILDCSSGLDIPLRTSVPDIPRACDGATYTYPASANPFSTLPLYGSKYLPPNLFLSFSPTTVMNPVVSSGNDCRISFGAYGFLTFTILSLGIPNIVVII